MNGYELSRSWFDFCFENPDLVKPSHTAIYFFAIEHCNRLGWKEKFGFPTTMVMETVGIKSYNTYIKMFNELVDFGFIKIIERSKNQYSSNIIAISKNNKANSKALDKALIKHTSKQSESTIQSIDSIDKQETNNNKQLTIEPKEEDFIEIEIYPTFDDFWVLYDKKRGKKETIEKKWAKLAQKVKEEIMDYIPNYIFLNPDKKYRKDPSTFLNNEAWKDELILPNNVVNQQETATSNLLNALKQNQ